jgi:lipid-binding SYLF domain-containing protein
MSKQMRFSEAIPSLLIAIACLAGGASFSVARAQSTTASVPVDASLQRDSLATLNTLYSQQPKAKAIGNKSRAILVFPRIVKAGLVVGGMNGKGVLLEHGKVTGVYDISAASFGLQAGAQAFSQVMFLATDSSLDYLHSSSGWSIGVGPSVVVVDQGMASSMTTDNLNSDVYVFIFGQQGLMGGLGVQGQKITRLTN